MIQISGKALGRKKPLFADWSIPFPPDLGDGGSLTLRDLISRVVRAEVAAFKERQQERRLLHALTASDIEQGVVRGKIDSGGHEVRQPVKEDEAVAVALEAFEDGLYLVILDEQEQKQLDQQVFLKPDSCVTFVRLTMLAGG
jgi:hypothetical protein